MTNHSHAYLMLLPIEVTAFHPATLPSWGWRRTEVAVPVLSSPRASLVSVALFLDGKAAGRLLAAIVPYGVRTFLDAKAPRLPSFPCDRYCNRDNMLRTSNIAR